MYIYIHIVHVYVIVYVFYMYTYMYTYSLKLEPREPSSGNSFLGAQGTPQDIDSLLCGVFIIRALGGLVLGGRDYLGAQVPPSKRVRVP